MWYVRDNDIKSHVRGEVMIKKIEYMCSYCGKKVVKMSIQGRPLPGRCPRKQGDKPHSWRKNRDL